MKAKIILGFGLGILMASSLNAGNIYYERDNGYRDYDHRDYKKSHKSIKRDKHRDSIHLSREEELKILKMREMKLRQILARERMQEQRRVQARIAEHEANKVAAIVTLATLPLIIHDIHMRDLAMIRDRY